MDIAAVVELDPYRAFNFGTGNNGVTVDLADPGVRSASALTNVEPGSGDNILGANFNFFNNGSLDIVSGENVDNNEFDVAILIFYVSISGADLDAENNSGIGVAIGVLASLSNAFVDILPSALDALIHSHGIINDVGDTGLLADLNGDNIGKEGDAGLGASGVLILQVEADFLSSVAISEANYEVTNDLLSSSSLSICTVDFVEALAYERVEINVALVIVGHPSLASLNVVSISAIPEGVTKLTTNSAISSNSSKILDAGEGHVEAAHVIYEIRNLVLNGNELIGGAKNNFLISYILEGNHGALRIGITILVQSLDLNGHLVVSSSCDSSTIVLGHSSNVKLQNSGLIHPIAIVILFPLSLLGELSAEVVLVSTGNANNGHGGDSFIPRSCNNIIGVVPIDGESIPLRVAITDGVDEILISLGQGNSDVCVVSAEAGISINIALSTGDNSRLGDSVVTDKDSNRNLQCYAHITTLSHPRVVVRLEFFVRTSNLNSGADDVAIIILIGGLNGNLNTANFITITVFANANGEFLVTLNGRNGFNILTNIPTSSRECYLGIYASPTSGRNSGLCASYRNQAD